MLQIQRSYSNTNARYSQNTDNFINKKHNKKQKQKTHTHTHTHKTNKQKNKTKKPAAGGLDVRGESGSHDTHE